MKKLKKLLINPEKVIKNEELVNLRGGSYEGPCCMCKDGNGAIGYVVGTTMEECGADCKVAYPATTEAAWLC